VDDAAAAGAAQGPSDEEPAPPEEPPPTLPSRTAFLIAFLSVVAAGLFGGIIGYGLVDAGSGEASGGALLLGTLLGAVCGAAGVGIVAVLVLRAQAEWRRPR
jgi:hypothetical protein